jgi:hypothetical protein
MEPCGAYRADMPDPQEWISQREASFVVQCGARVTERVARRVLAAGLAGEPRRVTTALLYERRRVVELAARPVVPDAELDSACSQGLFVSRRRGGGGTS